MLQPTRKQLETHQLSVFNRGRFANATVSLCRVEGLDWVVKDYAAKPWLIRAFYAPLMLRHEVSAMIKLQGLKGTPQDAYRVDAFAIAYRHMPGRTLAMCQPGEIPPGYFPALEQLVHDMHARGIAHLDLRYMHNVLIGDDDSPGLIDFQTCANLNRFPAWMSRWMRSVDLGGVYKHWWRRSPETMDDKRREFLEQQNRWRKYWFIEGYFRLRPWRKWKRQRKKRKLNP